MPLSRRDAAGRLLSVSGLGIAVLALPGAAAAASELTSGDPTPLGTFTVTLASNNCSDQVASRWYEAYIATATQTGESYRLSFTGDPIGTWHVHTATEAYSTGVLAWKFRFADPAGCAASVPSRQAYLGRFTADGTLTAVSEVFTWWNR